LKPFGDIAVNEHQIGEIYRKVLEFNRGAFANGEYEIAYNLLTVALRCGQRLGSIEQLKEVERLAETESRYLDDHHPESEYSSKAANPHGNVGLFQMTAQRARKLTRTLRK
jgi:hypothetical protein